MRVRPQVIYLNRRSFIFSYTQHEIFMKLQNVFLKIHVRTSYAKCSAIFSVAMRWLISFLQPLSCVQSGSALCSSATQDHANHDGRIPRKISYCLRWSLNWFSSYIYIYIYVLQSISNRIYTYFGLLLCLWNHATWLRCFASMCKLTQTFHNAYPVEKEAVVMKFHVSFHVKAKHRRHIAWFHEHKIEPKYA